MNCVAFMNGIFMNLPVLSVSCGRTHIWTLTFTHAYGLPGTVSD